MGPDDSIYIADNKNHCIRKISGKEVSTIAGVPGERGYRDGAADQALFNNPRDVDIDDHGNIYVNDRANNLIRKIDPSGAVTTVTGVQDEDERVDGSIETASFNYPFSLHIDGRGNILVGDYTSLRYIDLSSNIVSTITGHEESALPEDDINNPRISGCLAVSLDYKGNIISADELSDNNYRLIVAPHSGGISSHMQRLSEALSTNKPSPLSTDLGNMLTNAKDFESNVTFLVGESKFLAHRNILMARSDYFKSMFNSGFRESDRVSNRPLEIMETSPEAFRSLLTYLYTGDAASIINSDVVCDVIELANRYVVCGLEKYCLWYIESRMLSESNAIELLVWSSDKADMGLYIELRGKIKTYILEHFKSIKENHLHTLDLLKSYPEIMLEMFTLCEYALSINGAV